MGDGSLNGQRARPFTFSLVLHRHYFIMPGYHSFPVINQHFIVDKKFQFIREMGQGAYGVVW